MTTIAFLLVLMLALLAARPASAAMRVKIWSRDNAATDEAETTAPSTALTVFKPHSPNGVGILVTPGGGYEMVATKSEGSDVATALSAYGYTIFVLNYRLPDSSLPDGNLNHLADAQRSMRYLKHNAVRLGLDPQKIGILGFSAGGHLAACMTTGYAENFYSPKDQLDTLSARPDFMMLIYPVISMHEGITHAGTRRLMLGEAPDEESIKRWSAEFRTGPDMPPSFLVHCEDDAWVPSANTLVMYHTLKKNGVPVELHLFAEGGHAFGTGLPRQYPASLWTELAAKWLGRTINAG